MEVVNVLGNWTWLIAVFGLLALMVWLVPLFETKKERAQGEQARTENETAAVRAAEVRARLRGRTVLGGGRGPGRIEAAAFTRSGSQHRKDRDS